MIKEMYVVGDDSRLVVKSLMNELKATECEVHVIYPEPEYLNFICNVPVHLVLCLSEGMDFDVIRKLSKIQKDGNLNIYTVGSMQMSIDEQELYDKLPSIRFPTYSLDISLLLDLMEKNDVERKRILVVDDEPIMLRNIKTWLGKDFDVSLVNSGQTALQFLDMHPTDLVLLDYKMPVMDGPLVLKKIRDTENLAYLPVMFLTAQNDRESIMNVMHLKPEGYILKSRTPEEIRQAVIDFFKNRIVFMQ
ncbi:two-component system response regulator [uncultured Treponema sp.]|uniref:response regulator n=1 Tax=uncultured Treponema sp. TaxID=162155 RepID=UPI0025EADD6E|nr:response regulator transcription factor [uncultured Treponema sp.]